MTGSPVPGARVRLSRAAGWRKPACAVVVARPTRWGNPFDHREHGRAAAVEMYAAWLGGDGPDEQADRTGRRYSRARLLAALGELAGADLACWCPPGEPCHADVLLTLAADAARPGRRVIT